MFVLLVDGMGGFSKIVYFVLHELFILIIFALFYIIWNDKIVDYVSRNKT